MRFFSSILLTIGALLIAADASARDIVIDDAGFSVTLALPPGEPGCVVLPEKDTVAKDCAGIDLEKLRGRPVRGDQPDHVVAYVVEGGVVFVKVQYEPQPGRAYPSRETLESWAATPFASAFADSPGVSASGEVVEIGGVGAVHVRVAGEAGGQRKPGHVYRVPAPKGLVQIGFVATGRQAEAEMNRFAEATVASLRVAKPPPSAPVEQPASDATDWGTTIAVVLMLAGVLGLGGWRLTRGERPKK